MSRTKQRRIQQRVLNHEHEKAQAFLGSAKIDIVHLCFDDALGRAPDKKNEEFLLDSFRRHGCEQLNSAYRVPATIHAGILQTALSRSNLTPAQLLERDPALLPLLHLPHGTRIQCFLGAHRIRAAQQVLPRDQQWWVVDLYPDGRSALLPQMTTDHPADISSELRVSLSQQGSNERRLNEGEVLCRIIKARVHLQSDQEDFWWTRLPSGEQKCQAERLLSRRDFRTVLGRLSDIPALFLDFLTGMVGALLRLKCDEEILHGWRRIEQCWTSLLTEDTVALGKLKHEDVKALQLRCPALYQADRALLEPLFQKGQILRQFSPAEREQIWHRLLQYQALVPSFHSFFGNLHYLAAIASCLKLLVHLDYRQTVADAFEAAFSGDRAALADDARVGEVSLSSTNSRANVAYRQVVLHIMQQLLLLRSESILTGTGPKLTRALGGPAKQRLAVIAQQYGFRSASIDQLISHDPDREVAREVLLAVQAAVTTDCSEARTAPLVDQIVKVFAEFRRQTTPLAPLSWAPLDEEGEKSGEEVEQAGGRDGEIQARSLDHRRGLPSRHAYEQSCHALTFAQIHAPVPDGLTGPSAFLIQRDIYLFFYGDLNPSPTAAISAVAAGNIRAALTSTPVQETTLHETGATEAMDVSEDFPNETTSTALTLYQEPPGTVPTISVNTNSIYTVRS